METKRVLSRLLLLGILAAAAASCRTGTTEIGRNAVDQKSETLADVRVSNTDADAAEPAIARDKDGNIHVVYVDHTDKSTADVFIQTYDNGLKPLREKVRVSPDGTAKTWRGDPPTVAAAPDGSLYVAWTRVNAAGRGSDLVVSVSRDGGITFSGPVKVNDDVKPASHGMHSMAVDKEGRVYLAWLDERNVMPPEHTASLGDGIEPAEAPDGAAYLRASHPGSHKAEPEAPAKHEMQAAEPNSEVFFAVSSDGGKTFSPNRKVAAEVCPCCKTSMLASADGRIYLSWRQVLPGDLRHIAVASTADKGETFSERVIVSDDQWRIHACPVSGAALADAGGNKLTVTWYTAGDSGQAGVYMAESADGGKSFGPRQLVSSEAAAGTPVSFGKAERCVFAVESSTPGGSSLHAGGSTIANASLPAAAVVGEKMVTAFVRSEGGKRSIWLSAIS